MSESPWEKEYRQFLQEQLEKGAVSIRAGKAEARKHPRFMAGKNIVRTRHGISFALSDYSFSGMGFFSNQKFEVGDEFDLTINGIMSLQAQVVTSTKQESNPMFFDEGYRVGCHFVNELEDFQLLALAKNSEEIRIGG